MPDCIAATATRAVGGGLESREKDLIVAAEEPVTSPDQHAPTPVKAARIAGTVVIVMLLLMLFGNHEGNVESIWLIGIAGLLAVIMIIDIVLRRNGLRD
ncbi:hypothetical protein Cme02nite_62250 [Catellatospora methionotrophica]|uniref:DUF2631 domain-containing protein n=1 Tax=Catellatospora methionotrophica TaxID=121620 RepID=A0A8J3LGG7_9ACTN|nr:hypothetical protein Cme02nite_62250 [Catellatospora methionotrophica]